MYVKRSACEVQEAIRLCFYLLYFYLVFDTSASIFCCISLSRYSSFDAHCKSQILRFVHISVMSIRVKKK